MKQLLYKYRYSISTIIFVLLIVFLYCITIEHYDNISEYTDKKVIDELYKLMRMFIKVCNKHNIKYYIDSGTLLGAVRHKGIIPWDDDIDICIHEKDRNKILALKHEFNKLGYDIEKYWGDYKLFSLSGSNMKPENSNWVWKSSDGSTHGKGEIKYRYPFIDIYFVDLNKKTHTYGYNNKKNKQLYLKFYHNKQDLNPLKLYKFNNMKVYGPNNPYPYLNRVYPNWQHIGIKNYDHQNMQKMNKTIMQF